MVIDYATRHPEAMPFRAIMAKAVAQELAVLFTQVGFPKQIVMDQGMVFMGKTLTHWLSWWDCKCCKPQYTIPKWPHREIQRHTEEDVENVQGGTQDWHRWVPFLLSQ